MSGHSKWSTIKRKKGAQDQKRGKIFTRCIHEITVAVREGPGGDPNSNPRLRLAVDKAKSVNMPNENIDRAIKRATGELKGDEQQELIYEGYGPGGTAVMVEVVTDNKNRTVGEVRHAFTKCGGSLGETGCVGYLFNKKGLILISKNTVSEDELFEVALDLGAEDVSGEDEEMWEVTCEPAAFMRLREELEKRWTLELSETQMLPTTRIDLTADDAPRMERLLDMLDDLDDVINVFSNCNFPEGHGEE